MDEHTQLMRRRAIQGGERRGHAPLWRHPGAVAPAT